MEIGFEVTQRGPGASPEAILEQARLGEELGYDSLWVNDHVVIPREVQTPYLYSPTGRHPFSPDELYLEGLTLLSFLAACTRKPKLGISVLILPQRNPVLAAKVLATLDFLSGGRVIFGVGTGWLKEEFEALDMPFAERGARTDEFLRLMKALWTDDHPRFEGRYYRLAEVGFYPKPVQRPHLPIWVGGDVLRALRRAAALGDSYHPADRGQEPFANIEARYQRVRELAAGYGRPPDAVSFTLRTAVNFAKEDTASVVRRFRQYQEAGVAHAMINFQSLRPEDILESSRRFAREVRPALAS